MKSNITKLNTRIRMQKERISGLENQLLGVREALAREQTEIDELKEKIEWHKKRIANRDEKIKELTT